MFHNAVCTGQGDAVNADYQPHQLKDFSHGAGMSDHFSSTACHMLLHMPRRAGENPRQTMCHSKQAQLSKRPTDARTCPVQVLW